MYNSSSDDDHYNVSDCAIAPSVLIASGCIYLGVSGTSGGGRDLRERGTIAVAMFSVILVVLCVFFVLQVLCPRCFGVR